MTFPSPLTYMSNRCLLISIVWVCRILGYQKGKSVEHWTCKLGSPVFCTWARTRIDLFTFPSVALTYQYYYQGKEAMLVHFQFFTFPFYFAKKMQTNCMSTSWKTMDLWIYWLWRNLCHSTRNVCRNSRGKTRKNLSGRLTIGKS